MHLNELEKQAAVEHLENANFKKAEELYLKAAELGSGYAAHQLGVLYITGGEGVEPHPQKSQYWLEKSLESGLEKTIASDPEWFRKKIT